MTVADITAGQSQVCVSDSRCGTSTLIDHQRLQQRAISSPKKMCNVEVELWLSALVKLKLESLGAIDSVVD